MATCHVGSLLVSSCHCRREGLVHVSKLLVWLHECGCMGLRFAAFGILIAVVMWIQGKNVQVKTFTLIPVCMTILRFMYCNCYYCSLKALDWTLPGSFLAHSAPQILLYLAGSSCCVYCCGSLAQLQVRTIANGFFRVVWISLWHALPTGCPSILTQSVDALHTVGRVWGAWWGVLLVKSLKGWEFLANPLQCSVVDKETMR